MMLLGLVLIAALAVASYELWRRRGPARTGPNAEGTNDPPPHLLADDGDGGDGGDADGDGGS